MWANTVGTNAVHGSGSAMWSSSVKLTKFMTHAIYQWTNSGEFSWDGDGWSMKAKLRGVGVLKPFNSSTELLSIFCAFHDCPDDFCCPLVLYNSMIQWFNEFPNIQCAPLSKFSWFYPSSFFLSTNISFELWAQTAGSVFFGGNIKGESLANTGKLKWWFQIQTLLLLFGQIFIHVDCKSFGATWLLQNEGPWTCSAT